MLALDNLLSPPEVSWLLHSSWVYGGFKLLTGCPMHCQTSPFLCGFFPLKTPDPHRSCSNSSDLKWVMRFGPSAAVDSPINLMHLHQEGLL